jgi:DNA-binding transcriptional MerR regulator
MNPATEQFTIGEAARRAGVTARTIRYYEELGLVTPLRPDGSRRRLFTPFHVRILADIQQLASLGFTLEEIGQIIALKRVFFDPDGRERAFKPHEVPLAPDALDALRRKTRAVTQNIKAQQAFIDRVSKFLSRFDGPPKKEEL